MAARSGGLPPSTAVESNVARLSPPDVYLTVTFGYFAVKPSMTAWNESCSSPPQVAITEIEPVTSVLPPELLPPLSPPQPAATIATTPTSSADTSHRRLPSSFPLDVRA